MKNRQELKSTLTALLVMLLWGSLFPCVKLGYKAFSINTGHVPSILLFAGIRFVVCGAVIILVAAVLKRPMKIEHKSDVSLVALVGLFSVVLHYACTYVGLAHADSGKTALLKQLGVFVFIPLSFLFFKEDKFSIKKVFAAILGFGGIIVLNRDAGGIALGIGEVLIVAASLCTVSSGVASKHALKRVDPIVMTGYSQLFGGLLLLVIGLIAGGKVGGVSIKAVLIFSYICIASIIGYCLWNKTVKDGNLSKLYIIKFSEPIFAALIGAALLGEQVFTLEFGGAFLLVLAAILLSGK